jgi:hypothetical protein
MITAIAGGLLGRDALYSIPAWRACGPSIAALVVSSYSCQCVHRCISLGSMAGQIGLAGGAAYGATKATLAA